MPAISALSLADGQPTPVVRTFSPVNVVNGVASYADRSGGIQVGFPTINLQMRAPTKASRLNKVLVKIDIPVLEQTSASTSTGIQPAPVKAYSVAADLTIYLPERSQQIDRKNIAAILKNFVSSTVFSNMVADYDVVYG